MRVLAVPVKPLERSKTRLAPLLSPSERATVTLSMLDDVLGATLALADWETWVVSGSREALEAAAGRGALPVKEEGRTLLQAVRQTEAAMAEHAPKGEPTALAIVLADLPLITPRALAEALSAPGPVVAVPAESDGGTNLLLRRPPTAIAAKFGRSSFERHRAAAYREGLTFREERIAELAFDLDRPEDLLTLLQTASPSRTAAACRELGLAERLRVGA
jgi:2-phospho-L-lactate guanylyltransferase